MFLCNCAFSGEEREPNNQKDDGNSITSNEIVTGHTGVKTKYGFSGDMDIYSFKAKYPGKLTVHFTVKKKFGNISGKSSLRLEVLNEKELKAGEWKDPYTGKSSPAVFTCGKEAVRTISFQKSGIIFLCVDRYEGDGYYEFSISYNGKGKPEEKVFDAIKETEPNDTAENAMKLSLKHPVSGHTGNKGKYGIEGNKDIYSISVPSPGKLSIFLTIEGKYFKEEKGKPSVKISLINSSEMASGEWKNIYTGEDEKPVFYQGTDGKSILIKSPGKILLLVDRYEANPVYKMTVLFQRGQ